MNEANHNPLIAPLLVLLQQAAGSYKVHELMAALR
ncbi:MAG: DNA-J related domain-containing protein, partial [Aeromonas veronii]